MATTVTTTIGPDTEDYATAALWVAGEIAGQNLTTLDEIHKGLASAFVDSSQCNIDGCTSDSTRYPELTAVGGHGTVMPPPTDGTVYYLRYNGANAALTLSDLYAWVHDIAVANIGSGSARAVDFADQAGLEGCRLERVYGRVGDGGTNVYACFLLRGNYGPTDPYYAHACVGHIVGATTPGNVFKCDNTNALRVRNCTGFSEGTGTVFAASGSTTKQVVNGLAYGGGASFSGTWESGSDYNWDEDGTAPGANSQTLSGDPFENSGAGDLHLASGSEVVGTGTDLSAYFTLDWDGDTFSSWSAGADDGPGGGGTVALDFSLASTSTIAADLSVQRPLTASVASVSAVSMALSVQRRLVAAIASTSDLQLSLSVVRGLTMDVASVSDVQAALSVLRQFSLALSSVSVVAMDLTVDQQTLLDFAVASSSSIQAALSVRRGLQLDVATVSAMQAQLAVLRRLTAALASTSDVQAALSVQRSLQFALASDSDMAILLTVAGMGPGTLIPPFFVVGSSGLTLATGALGRTKAAGDTGRTDAVKN